MKFGSDFVNEGVRKDLIMKVNMLIALNEKTV